MPCVGYACMECKASAYYIRHACLICCSTQEYPTSFNYSLLASCEKIAANADTVLFAIVRQNILLILDELLRILVVKMKKKMKNKINT